MPGTSDPDTPSKTEASATSPSAGSMPEGPAQPRPTTPEPVPRSNAPPEGTPPLSESPSPQDAGPARITVGVLAGLASQAVILAAVLFYFGWARAKATYGYFGVDISVLNFSASDYILRSVGAAFPLLVAIGLVGLGAMVVHEQLLPGLASDAETAGRLARGAVWTGAGLVAAGLVLALALTGPGGSDFFGPAVLLIGCALAAYGFAMRNRYGSHDGFRFFVAMATMAVVALLWTVTAYANYIGIQVAKEIRSGLPTAAEVTVYSSTDLSLSGPGITVSRIQVPYSEYRFRYSGLRILISSGGQYFLVPSGWRQGHGSVIVLPAASGGNIRVEFTAPVP